MDGHFDLGIFIVGSMVFFVLPLAIIIGIINFFITNRMHKHGLQKSRYYWPKLIGVSAGILIVGLLLYDGYYKLMG